MWYRSADVYFSCCCRENHQARVKDARGAAIVYLDNKESEEQKQRTTPSPRLIRTATMASDDNVPHSRGYNVVFHTHSHDMCREGNGDKVKWHSQE